MTGLLDVLKLDIHEYAPGAGPRHVRGATLIAIRWVAIIGQTATVLIVAVLFEMTAALVICLAAIVASAMLNLFLSFRFGARRQLTQRFVLASLAFDTAQLALLLGLTGGLHNPFSILLLAPVTVSATILSAQRTLTLGLFALLAISILAIAHMPVPGPAPQLALIYSLAAWVATVVGTIFIAGYVVRVASEHRRMQEALGEVRTTLQREQQVSAVGALAAAAAHELGTPLATISLVSKELMLDLPDGSEAAEDAALLVSQAERCRDILAELAARPSDDSGAEFYPIPLTALVGGAATQHRRPEIAFTVLQRPLSDGAGPEPRVQKTPELVNGLVNILSNALQFAKTEVKIVIEWDAEEIRAHVSDDGPGFLSDVLDRIGEPYISTRAEQDGHMGLGLFIARTLLENTGASLTFANGPEGGAAVQAVWARVLLEAKQDETR
jgi:two-component system, sensor histidine kinase RegB